MQDSDFVAMMSGVFSVRMGFMTGKLKLEGDMMVAMRLGRVLAAVAA